MPFDLRADHSEHFVPNDNAIGNRIISSCNRIASDPFSNPSIAVNSVGLDNACTSGDRSSASRTMSVAEFVSRVRFMQIRSFSASHIFPYQIRNSLLSLSMMRVMWA